MGCSNDGLTELIKEVGYDKLWHRDNIIQYIVRYDREQRNVRGIMHGASEANKSLTDGEQRVNMVGELDPEGVFIIGTNTDEIRHTDDDYDDIE